MAKHKHIFISQNVKVEKYKQGQKQGKTPKIPQRDILSHSEKLLKQFEQIWKEKENVSATRTAESITTKEGTYLSFTSALNSDLITKSLENIKKGIRLLNIKENVFDDSIKQTKATVYIPNGMEGFFISKIIKYKNEMTKSGKAKNAPLVNSIEDISIALLEGLWTDKEKLIPNENSKWCEAWLNLDVKNFDSNKKLENFNDLLDTIGIEFKKSSIVFPERIVVLINANREQLIELMMQSDLLAEFRAGQETAGFWMNETSIEQQEWVEDLLNRIEISNDIKTMVCILDTGVNNGHQLIKPILSDDDTLTVDPTWGTNDHGNNNGHGTMMAGVVGYGDFENVLISTDRILLTHKICSVKILPPTEPGNSKELWGDITSQAISKAEIQNPNLTILYCMAVASIDDVDKGRPSSWSGAIDNLTFNEGENQRLFIICAGNVEDVDTYVNYPHVNFLSSIQNPSQSWNALVIGAYTEKVIVNDPNFNNHIPIAKKNQLSPYSSTSLVWEKRWPVKPDVVFEGGNLLLSPDGLVKSNNDLDLLSTSKKFNTKPFNTFWATSAATAKASWFAAKVATEYPDAWAETIRGLIIHSASWTEEMLTQMGAMNGNRKSYKNLLRVFGYGVPNLEKALYSNESAFTFISQETIQPFSFGKTNNPETNQIHFYSLPWPKELLISMNAIPVKLRVTLSYFIEPGAGEIGWKDKYRYQSHGLRFDVNNVDEQIDDFRKRVNVEAREKDETLHGSSGSNRWKIGSNNNNRTTGSVHSDFWEGTAAELATCNFIAVYPIIGWWRERKNLGKVENKTRYSLLISLETPEQNVEVGLYTTVMNIINIPIETAIEITTS
jgi:Subtilase family